MFKTKTLSALILAAASLPSFAQIGPITIEEWSNRQAEIKRAELDAKLEEQKRKSLGTTTPAQIAKTCDDEISLYAVYGVDKRLRADFGYRGATVTLSPGDSIDVGGWYVDELSPSRALMVKRAGKKVVSRCPVYLSTITKPPVYSVPTDGSVSVPPILPTPAESPSKSKATDAQKPGSMVMR